MEIVLCTVLIEKAHFVLEEEPSKYLDGRRRKSSRRVKERSFMLEVGVMNLRAIHDSQYVN